MGNVFICHILITIVITLKKLIMNSVFNILIVSIKIKNANKFIKLKIIGIVIIYPNLIVYSKTNNFHVLG